MLSVSVDIVVDAFFYFVVAVEEQSLLLTSLHLTNITSNTALINCVNPHPTLMCLGTRSLFLTEKKKSSPPVIGTRSQSKLPNYVPR